MPTIDHQRRLVLHAAVLTAVLTSLPILARAERVKGSGKLKQQSRSVAGFTGVSLALDAKVELRQGPAAITVQADDNLLPLIETVVENGMLKIRPLRRALDFSGATIRIAIAAPRIDSLTVGGSGAIAAHGLRTPELRADIGGSGSITLHAPELESLNVNLGGSGSLQALGGNARKISVGVGGSGTVKLDTTRVVHASVNLAGSGKVLLNVREVLKVIIAGSGDVSYYGDPQVSKTVAGSGTVSRLGPLR